MAEFDVTMVHRGSGKHITERMVARDMEDARGKCVRDGWLTGSITLADPAADLAAEEARRMRVSDAEWSQLYRTVRRGVIVGTLICTAIMTVVGLLAWAIIVMVAEAS